MATLLKVLAKQVNHTTSATDLFSIGNNASQCRFCPRRAGYAQQSIAQDRVRR